jgi:ubiquinone/menaquinone biosynthesis C-methylase UbiE
VLKKGGRMLILEFSHVQNPLMGQVYDQFSFNVIPRMGQLVAGDAPSYQYLVESIRRFPKQVSATADDIPCCASTTDVAVSAASVLCKRLSAPP